MFYNFHEQGTQSVESDFGLRENFPLFPYDIYEGWNFNSGNYLFTTDTK